MTETPERPERATMLNRCCAVNRNGYRCEVNTGERHEIHRAFVNEHDEQGKIPEFRWREVDGDSASSLGEPVSQEAPGLPPGESPQRNAVCDALTEALLYIGVGCGEACERTTIDLEDRVEVRGLARMMTVRDPEGLDGSLGENTKKLWERIGTALASRSAFSGIPRTENEESARIRFGVREVGTAPRRRDKWATRARAELELTRWRQNNPSLNYELVEIRTTERALKENPVADAGPYLGCKPCEDDANV